MKVISTKITNNKFLLGLILGAFIGWGIVQVLTFAANSTDQCLWSTTTCSDGKFSISASPSTGLKMGSNITFNGTYKTAVPNSIVANCLQDSNVVFYYFNGPAKFPSSPFSFSTPIKNLDMYWINGQYSEKAADSYDAARSANCEAYIIASNGHGQVTGFSRVTFTLNP